jgi:hypothetical protein
MIKFVYLKNTLIFASNKLNIMIKIYYTIDKSVSSDGETLYGNKTVTVYEIVDNIPEVFFTLDLVLEDNSLNEIKDYLNDNGYSDKSFEINLL